MNHSMRRGLTAQEAKTLSVATHFETTWQPVNVSGLPAAFEGFTIAQLSDMHIDRWNIPALEKAIQRINALRVDLVVCTGDTIAHGREYLSDLTYLLRQIQARVGKIACLGNHDYSDGEGGLGVRRSMQAGGFEVLVNDSLTLWQQHQRLQVAGLDDLLLGQQCLNTVARRLDADYPLVMLSHNPSNFDAVATLRPDLMLSGHTHGGQIPVPQWLYRKLFGSPYIAGSYWKDQSRLYVNRGLGVSVLVHHWMQQRLSLPTPRWKVRAELSLFTLTCSNALEKPLHALQPHREALSLAGGEGMAVPVV